MKELRDTIEVIFGKRGIWEVVNRDGMIVVVTKSAEMLEAEQSFDVEKKTLTPAQKKMFLKMVCEGKYTEDDLIFIRVVDDFSSGFAFTKDSFCIGGDLFAYQTTVSKFRSCIHKRLRRV